MKKKLQLKLLPHRFQTIGYIIITITVIASFALLIFDSDQGLKSKVAPLLQLLIILSLLLIILSKEKREDEFVQQLREQILARTAISLIALAALDVVLRYIFKDEEGIFQNAAIMLEVFYLVQFHYNKHYLGEYE